MRWSGVFFSFLYSILPKKLYNNQTWVAMAHAVDLSTVGLFNPTDYTQTKSTHGAYTMV
jgi:hypothetical protein